MHPSSCLQHVYPCPHTARWALHLLIILLSILVHYLPQVLSTLYLLPQYSQSLPRSLMHSSENNPSSLSYPLLFLHTISFRHVLNFYKYILPEISRLCPLPMLPARIGNSSFTPKEKREAEMRSLGKKSKSAPLRHAQEVTYPIAACACHMLELNTALPGHGHLQHELFSHVTRNGRTGCSTKISNVLTPAVSILFQYVVYPQNTSQVCCSKTRL